MSPNRNITVAISVWAQCRPRNTQNGITVLMFVNLMADSEYSSFLVTIHLSHLVSEIFKCDRQQTMQTITIAGPHIVAGQQAS